MHDLLFLLFINCWFNRGLVGRENHEGKGFWSSRRPDCGCGGSGDRRLGFWPFGFRGLWIDWFDHCGPDRRPHPPLHPAAH